ncbi:MAG: WYL domain-containing protein [Vicinamibacteria bacterium]|nr:WYL domain-containing protein [Vicinamibacteria bacterium]
MRNSEVVRQWNILKTIEAGRYTSTAALAEEHGVSDRTIRRDIEALQEAGFPLYDEYSEGHRLWRLIEGYEQRLTQTFTLSEMAALFFGKNLMSILAGGPFARDLETAFEKIQDALPKRSLGYLARIQDLFAARPEPFKDYSKKKDIIEALIDATLHQRRARMVYFSYHSKEKKTYTIDAYRVLYYHGGLYVYAFTKEHGEVRTFAVERIEKIEVLEQEFEMPRDFDISDYTRGAFGIAGGRAEPVELIFDKEVGSYIRERVWHESQVMQDGPDGTVIVKMNVVPGWELRSWIKGFLPYVSVIAPATLKAKIAHDLSEAAAKL